MKKVLFINTRAAQCSIYESGIMFYRSIDVINTDYQLTYIEIDQLDKESLYQGKTRSGDVELEFDVYIFNYHPGTMREIERIDSSRLNKFKGKTISLILEMKKDDPLPESFKLNEEDFDEYIVLDPTLKSTNKKFHSFPRPLPSLRNIIEVKEIPRVPIIGTFGLPGEDKNFPGVIEQASREFDYSIVRINIPQATFIIKEATKWITDECLDMKPDNVDLIITHKYFTQEELITWCQQNHLNVFLYNRDFSGLAAAPDQVLMAGAPMIVSGNTTFRHLHPYISYFPKISFKEAMLTSQLGIRKLRALSSSEQLVNKFRTVIKNL